MELDLYPLYGQGKNRKPYSRKFFGRQYSFINFAKIWNILLKNFTQER